MEALFRGDDRASVPWPQITVGTAPGPIDATVLAPSVSWPAKVCMTVPDVVEVLRVAKSQASPDGRRAGHGQAFETAVLAADGVGTREPGVGEHLTGRDGRTEQLQVNRYFPALPGTSNTPESGLENCWVQAPRVRIPVPPRHLTTGDGPG